MAFITYKRVQYNTHCDKEYLALSNEVWDGIIEYYERNNLTVPSEEQLILEHEEALDRVINFDEYHSYFDEEYE